MKALRSASGLDCSRRWRSAGARWAGVTLALMAATTITRADSVNSPNIVLNVDTNRSVGAGAGGVALVVNTITIAETMLPEYSSGAASEIVLQVRPGFQFDPMSPIMAQSATIGLNGGAINVAATVTPSGVADEEITFTLTSGTSPVVQDILRITGVRLLIRSPEGAAGPAQTTLNVTTATAGGAFTNQGIVAANITRGAPDRLVFSAQPGSTQATDDLLPAIAIVDFGGNLILNDERLISLTIQDNPSAAALLGALSRQTVNGVATWTDADDLSIAAAGAGYTLRASHDGAAFLTSDTAESAAFDILAGPPNRLEFSLEPVDTIAGGDILVAVTVKDSIGNTVTTPAVDVTLDAAVNPNGWPLLVETSLSKSTVDGVAEWDATDGLRINKAVADYQLRASGVGAPVDSAVFDILAGPPSALRFGQQPTDTRVASVIDPPITVEILDAFANRVDSDLTIDLVLQTACGGALSGGAGAASAGLATFNTVRVDTPCELVSLEAAAGGLPRTSSDPFDITALPPVALRFVQQPTAAEAGENINPPISVEVIDAAGGRTDSGATIELTLVSSCGGVLSTTSAAAVGGVATFAMTSIDTPCAAISLQATADDLVGATSDVFDITAAATDPNELMDMPACGACGAGGMAMIAPMLVMLAVMKLHFSGGRGGRARKTPRP